MPSRHGEIIEVETPAGSGEMKKFKIVELPVDPPNSVRRILVPVETQDEDIPVGARLLDERETDGYLSRSSKPDNILVGDMVRKKLATGATPTEADSIKGTAEAVLKSGKIRVRFENGVVETFKPEELAKVW